MIENQVYDLRSSRLKPELSHVENMSVDRTVTLYLLRHAQDLASQRSKFEDLKLTIEGESQARKLASTLSIRKISKIYSSPLIRAKETAKIIGQILNLEPRISHNLRDRYMGKAEGLTYQQVQSNFSHILSQSMFHIDFRFPDGESNGDVFERAQTFIDELFSVHAGTSEEILIISHPLVLNYVCYQLMNIGFQENLLFNFEYGFGAVLRSERGSKLFQLIEFTDLGGITHQ